VDTRGTKGFRDGKAILPFHGTGGGPMALLGGGWTAARSAAAEYQTQ
jgi:hypothetical protein